MYIYNIIFVMNIYINKDMRVTNLKKKKKKKKNNGNIVMQPCEDYRVNLFF
jgi:hypothetical protein